MKISDDCWTFVALFFNETSIVVIKIWSIVILHASPNLKIIAFCLIVNIVPGISGLNFGISFSCQIQHNDLIFFKLSPYFSFLINLKM